MSDETIKTVGYTNEVSVSISGSDAVVTYRWMLPKLDENNNIIGKICVSETVLSMTTELLKKSAENILGLLKTAQSNEDIEHK